jgi:hypothetical protein
MRENDRAIRSDLDAHDHVVGLPIREVVRELVQILGATTVAALGGVKETRAVQQWMANRDPQRPHALRFALQIGLMLSSQADRELTQAWFHAANPRLDDRIPMLLIRDLPLDRIQQPLLHAARAFIARGDRATS